MSAQPNYDAINDIISHHQAALADCRHNLEAMVVSGGGANDVGWRQEQYVQQAELVGITICSDVIAEYKLPAKVTSFGLPNLEAIRESIGWFTMSERRIRVHELEQHFHEATNARQRHGFGSKLLRSYVNGPLEQIGGIANYGSIHNLTSLEKADWEMIDQQLRSEARYFALDRRELLRPNVFGTIMRPQLDQEAQGFRKAIGMYLPPAEY